MPGSRSGGTERAAIVSPSSIDGSVARRPGGRQLQSFIDGKEGIDPRVGNGGQESQCGWCRDRWGLSWQITPRVLTDALAAGGAEAKRAFAAMMPMKTIDVATIEAARRG